MLKPMDGGVWKDKTGKHINAHGGNIFNYKGTYYWYGESRSATGNGQPILKELQIKTMHKKKLLILVLVLAFLPFATMSAKKKVQQKDRDYWASLAT